MQKLIERIGTEAHKCQFFFHIDKFLTHHPTSEHYRVALKRKEKQLYSNYFKAESSTQTSLKEVVNLSATMYRDKRSDSYQSKKFELIVYRSNKDQQIQQSKFDIDLGEVAVKKILTKSFRDQMTSIEVTIESESLEKGHSVDRPHSHNSLSQECWGNANRILTSQVKTVQERPVEESKKRPVEVIKFDDEVQMEQSILSNPLNALIINSKDKNTSFRNLKIKEEKTRDVSQERVRARRSRSKSQLKPNKPPKPTWGTEAGIQEKLYELENQLGEERMRKSTLYEDINQEKEEVISRLRQENSELQTTINRFSNELEFSNREIKDLEGRYDSIYKKLNKTIEECRNLKDQREKLANDNAELTSTIELLRSNKPDKSRVEKQVQKQVQKQIQKQQLGDISKWSKQLEQLKKKLNSLQKQWQSSQSQRVIMQNKYQEMLKKYKIASTQLSALKKVKEEQEQLRETEERQFYKELKQKEEMVMQLKREIKSLELKQLRPEDELSKKEHSLLKERLQKLMISFAEETRENKELEGFLRKEIESKSKENQLLLKELSKIEKYQSDEMGIYANREKSLTKALDEKDRKVNDLTNDLNKLRTKVSESNKFIESEKVELVKKMAFLSDQLTKRKEVSDELEALEIKSRQLENKVKRLGSEKEEMDVEVTKLKKEVELGQNKLKSNNASLSLIQELQGQLVKVNTKVAKIMTLLFEMDPKLAQTVIEDMGRS